ncbi:hypothetical protein Tco_1249970 [Tanacetum coccineum]
MERNFLKAQDKSANAIIAGRNKVTSLVSVQGPKKKKAFIGGAWSDSIDGNEPQKDTTYLMAINSQEAYDGGHVIFGSDLKGKVIGRGQLCDDDCVVEFTKVDCTLSKNGKTLAKGHKRNGLYTCKLGENSN